MGRFRVGVAAVVAVLVVVAGGPVGARRDPFVSGSAGAGRAVERAVAFVEAVDLARVEAAVGAVLVDAAAFIEAAERSAAALRRAPASRSSSASSGGWGELTDGQLAALNVCEASGDNGWRTGRYGLETGTNDVGSWSLEQQQAEARRIYRERGPTAWGVDCRDEIGG